MFTVILKDKDGCELGTRECDTLKDAKSAARYFLTDTFAAVCESTHEHLGTHKVEVLNEAGEVVWDDFL